MMICDFPVFALFYKGKIWSTFQKIWWSPNINIIFASLSFWMFVCFFCLQTALAFSKAFQWRTPLTWSAFLLHPQESEGSISLMGCDDDLWFSCFCWQILPYSNNLKTTCLFACLFVFRELHWPNAFQWCTPLTLNRHFWHPELHQVYNQDILISCKIHFARGAIWFQVCVKCWPSLNVVCIILAHFTITCMGLFLGWNFTRTRIRCFAFILAYLILRLSYLLILWNSVFSRILSHNFEGNISLVQTSRHDPRFNTNFSDFRRNHCVDKR